MTDTNVPYHTDAPPPLAATVALFVDFDGTLAPIAPRPQDVRVPEWVVPALHRWQRTLDGAIAVISGRPIVELDAFLQPLRLPAAGAHGAERRPAEGSIVASSATPPSSVVECAESLATQHEGLIHELKQSGLSLHYRARPELGETVRESLISALANAHDAHDAWELLHGHMVVELKQRGVSKGNAVRAFMAEPTFAGRLPVFVGDDVTDEDGIRAAQELGGYGVRVGAGDSLARYRLADTDAVAAWLGAASLDAAALATEPAKRESQA